jgi:hypothetical protein
MAVWLLRISTLACAGALVAFAWGYENGLCSSRARAEKEHGIALPSSATHIRCRGDAWGGFLDRGARAAFLMNSADLPFFLRQLDVRTNAVAVSYFRLPEDLAAEVGAAESTTLLEALTCRSPRGNQLDVKVWRVKSDTLAVNLHTDWN